MVIIFQFLYNLFSPDNDGLSTNIIYASKAFDRVEYVKLYSDLRERNLCPIVLHLLMNRYVNQCLQGRWNSLVSDRFSIANGVKQEGGGLSPILFSIYMGPWKKRARRSPATVTKQSSQVINQFFFHHIRLR